MKSYVKESVRIVDNLACNQHPIGPCMLLVSKNINHELITLTEQSTPQSLFSTEEPKQPKVDPQIPRHLPDCKI